MSSTADIIANGLDEGLKVILAGDLTDKVKLDEAIKQLAIRQAAIVDNQAQETLEAIKAKITLEELKQSDIFTRRARPTIVYAGLLFIFILNVFIPLIAFFNGSQIPINLKLPDEFWFSWSGVVSVWVLGRSYEKVNGVTGSISSFINGKK